VNPEVLFIYENSESLIFVPNEKYKNLTAKFKLQMLKKMIYTLEQEMIGDDIMKSLAPYLLQERLDP